MFVKRILILPRFEELVRGLQALVISNVKRIDTVTETVKSVRELPGSGRFIIKSAYFVRISKLTRDVQRRTGFV